MKDQQEIIQKLISAKAVEAEATASLVAEYHALRRMEYALISGTPSQGRNLVPEAFGLEASRSFKGTAEQRDYLRPIAEAALVRAKAIASEVRGRISQETADLALDYVPGDKSLTEQYPVFFGLNSITSPALAFMNPYNRAADMMRTVHGRKANSVFMGRVGWSFLGIIVFMVVLVSNI